MGEETALWPVQLSSISVLFEALYIENSLEKHYGISARTVSWSMQRWKCLNWWIADKFNWKTLTRLGYWKLKTPEFLYCQSMIRTAVKLSSVLKTQTTFPTTRCDAQKSVKLHRSDCSMSFAPSMNHRHSWWDLSNPKLEKYNKRGAV